MTRLDDEGKSRGVQINRMRALTQQPRILVMDEPTASLDMNNAVLVLRQILRLKKENISVLVTTHSANQAKVYADRILIIKQGRVFDSGDVSWLDNRRRLHAQYSVKADEFDDDRLREFISKAV